MKRKNDIQKNNYTMKDANYVITTIKLFISYCNCDVLREGRCIELGSIGADGSMPYFLTYCVCVTTQ